MGDIRRHIGRFTIDDRIIETAPEAVAQLMAGMVVLRAERRWDIDATVYDAWFPAFYRASNHARIDDYEVVAEYAEWRPDVPSRIVALTIKTEGGGIVRRVDVRWPDPVTDGVDEAETEA